MDREMPLTKTEADVVKAIVDRAVDGYAYLMCDDAVPVDDDAA